MIKETRWWFVATTIFIAFSIWLLWPRPDRLGHVHVPIQLGIDLQGGTELVYSLDLSRIEKDRSKVAEEVKDIISKRLNAYGLKEISVAVQGQDQLVIQVPGTDAQSVSELKAQIEKAGNLTFRLVAPEEYQTPDRIEQFVKEERAYIEADRVWVEKKVADPTFNEQRPQPPDYIVRVEVQKVNVGGREEFRPKPKGERVLENKHHYNEKTNSWEPEGIVSGSYLVAVGHTIDQTTFKPAVSFQFRGEGARLFGELTGPNRGRFLAVVLDDDIMEVATIRSQITDRGELSGNFSDEDVKGIITILRGGSLPTKPKINSETTVGSILGQDSIERGIRAVALGVAGVIVFMAFYYRIGGMVANVALMINLLLIMAFVACFRQTLTMPGLAGTLLTLGMAVDANILIFERYREEKKKGKTLVQALTAGYQRAFWVIFDSHMTTIITGYICFYLGTGPVKGFAVTLIAGLIASFFTAVYVTRLILSVLLNLGLRDLKLLKIFDTPRVPFTRYMSRLMTVTVSIIVVTWVFVIARGQQNYGIDFTGGARVTVNLSKSLTVEDMREKIATLARDEPLLFRDHSVQTLNTESSGRASSFVILTRAGAEEVGQKNEAPAGVTEAERSDTSSPGKEEHKTAQRVQEALEKMLLKENLLLPPPFPSVNWLAVEGGPVTGTAYLAMEVNLTKAPDLTEDGLKEKVNQWLDKNRLFTKNGREPGASYRGLEVESVQLISKQAEELLLTRYLLKTTSYQPPLAGMRDQSVPTKQQVEEAIRSFFQSETKNNTLRLSQPFSQVVTVGPKVATSLQADALVAVFLAFLAIVFYLALRFEFNYGVAGVVALVHDVLITIGVMVVTDYFFPTTFAIKFNLNELAAILTIIGFSINDTIVLFDRVRENGNLLAKKKYRLETLIDISTNQTLSRTLWTSLTVLIVTVILLALGGESIRGFAYIFAIGVVTGTYSSIFIASPVAIWLHNRSLARRAALAPVES